MFRLFEPLIALIGFYYFVAVDGVTAELWILAATFVGATIPAFISHYKYADLMGGVLGGDDLISQPYALVSAVVGFSLAVDAWSILDPYTIHMGWSLGLLFLLAFPLAVFCGFWLCFILAAGVMDRLFRAVCDGYSPGCIIKRELQGLLRILEATPERDTVTYMVGSPQYPEGAPVYEEVDNTEKRQKLMAEIHKLRNEISRLSSSGSIPTR